MSDDVPASKRLKTASTNGDGGDDGNGETSTPPEPTFAEAFPHGVVLAEGTVQLLSRAQKKGRAYTFDELTLADQPVDFHPNDVVLRTYVTRNIAVKAAGILSAAMDTVTEKGMAVAMAKAGGIGILHRNMEPKKQAEEVNWVRKQIHQGGMIENPVTFCNTEHFSDLQKKAMEMNLKFTSFPILDPDGRFMGMISRDSFDFVDEANPLLIELMTPLDRLITARAPVNSEKAYQLMKEKKIKKLPILDEEGRLNGLYVWNDVKRNTATRSKFATDDEGHFIVGAAIGLDKTEEERVMLLHSVGCKLIVIDSPSGANYHLIKHQIKMIRRLCGNAMQIIAGNVASYDGARYCLEGEARPDGLKVGIGAGMTSITRSSTGHGVPQVSAIFDVWKAVHDFGKKTGYYVPIIADGGIRSSGDIVKSFACGASGVMLGGMLAGCLETPGQVVTKHGRSFKCIRGMTYRSGAIMSEREINTQEIAALSKASHGVQGLVPVKGSAESVLTQLTGGVQAGLAHSGAIGVKAFQGSAQLWVQSFAGVAEGKPHDIRDVQG